MKIRELARELGVSIGTVSRALNNRPDVSPDTRQRVAEAAERFGYVANQSGRSLRQGVTNAIGFMMEVGSEVRTEGDGFFNAVLDGVQSVLQRHDLDLLVLTCRSGQDREAYLRRIVTRGVVDALIISATHDEDMRLEFLEARRTAPYVALGRSGSNLTHPWVDLDFETFMRTAVGRLVAFGHRRLALATGTSGQTFINIGRTAFRDAHVQHGLPVEDAMIVETALTERGGYDFGRDVLARPQRPTAVILQHESMAVGFYHATAEAGLRIGRDVSVIALRNSSHVRFLTPHVTAFAIDLPRLGEEVAEALLAILPAYAELYPRGVTRRLWPMTLVPGESDGPAPG